MDKIQRFSCVLVIICMLMIFAYGSDSIEEKEAKIEKQPSLIERFTTSLYGSPQTSIGHWDKLKALLNQGRSYVYPPNLDFRGGGEEKEAVSGHGTASPSGTTGEKVKEAVTTSLEKTKEALEDSAKSAAKFAGDTFHHTTQKAKTEQSEL